LVVDDSDINLDVTKSILELEGASVELANNGEQAFERLRTAPTSIDLVLMDIQMPVLDGYDATRRIRQELGLVNLPIIALTAGALSSERQRATAAGMNDYLIKPFDPPLLVTRILRYLKPARSPFVTLAPDAAAVGSGMRILPDTRPRAQWPEIEGIDSTEACARLGGDSDLLGTSLKRLLDEFCDPAFSPAGATPVSPALEAGRMHKLKGCAGMLGANEIHRLAGEAEGAYGTGKLAVAASLSGELRVQLRNLKRNSAGVIHAVQMHSTGIAGVAPGDCAALEPGALADLIDQLRRQSVSASAIFQRLSPQLKAVLGESLFDIVCDHVGNMRYSDAAMEITAHEAWASTLN
jgi:CheY-like chemotaxis protein